MEEQEEEKKESGISRRQFLKRAGIAAGAAASGATLAACTGKTPAAPPTAPPAAPAKGEAAAGQVALQPQPAGGGASATTAVLPAFEPEKTVYRDVSFCCGGNAAAIDVKNGKIIRIRPLHYDEKYKPEQYNPNGVWTIKARGKTLEAQTKTLLPPFSLAYKKRVYSPNRIKYPLKRVDWEPGGDPAKINAQNRGISKYKRISWDEAAQIIADESKRVRAKYGGSAIYAGMGGHGEQKSVHARESEKFLYEISGDGMYTPGTRNPDSWEGWFWGAKHAWGCEPKGEEGPQTNLILDLIENCEMHLMWGGDPETTTWGWGGQFSSVLGYFYTELGIKQVSVCPEVNYWTAVHADKWIPVLPNTDVALHFAIAYTWISEGTYDKEYVQTHSVGFDKFSDYVMGKGDDKLAKTPEWAAPICGVPEWTIKALAREWASKKTSIGHVNGGSLIRGPFNTEPGRMEPCLLAMQGWGKPGRHQVGYNEWGRVPPGYPLQKAVVYPTIANAGPRATKVQKQYVARMALQKGLIGDYTPEKPITWYGEGSKGVSQGDRTQQWEKVAYPAPKDQGGSRIHLLWHQIPNWITSWQYGYGWEQAYRTPDLECLIMQNIWMEDDTLFGDIILPANTKFETEDIAADVLSGNFHVVMYEQKCIDPVGDTKSDYEGVGEVAKKMGVYDKYTQGMTVEDRIQKAFNGSGVKDLVTWDEFKTKGYYVVPVDKNWESDWKNKEHTPSQNFADDPKKNPLSTQTGLFEFECQDLKEHFPDDRERPPLPHYIIGGPGWTHDESRFGEKVKKYPLLIESNHPRWRVHAEHDDIPWTREIPTCKVKGPDGYLYEATWINPKTAEKYGIKSGDIVKIFNDRGAVLGGAYVTERVMPGVVYQDHGARLDEIITGQLDRGGANNCISPAEMLSQNCTGMATSGFLVEVAKVTGTELDEWRQKYPEAFARPYDPTYGPLFEAWLA